MKPRVGFLGVGWIGRHRMRAITESGKVDAVVISDPSPECVAAAITIAPAAQVVGSLAAMLDLGVDGVVIATPSALHAEQAITALRRGAAVFCQKPVARTAAETRAVVAAAREADRLLGVDFSYRHTEAMRAIRELVRTDVLGKIFAVDLVFHNAYGPDKPWFYDWAQSGGGCAIDLGIHLVDLVLWTLDFPLVDRVKAHLFADGAPLRPGRDRVEDFALAELVLTNGTVARLACSWRLPAGREAVIEASFYGTSGGAAMRNIAGSFYDFTAEHFSGTSAACLAAPPDPWGGRAAAAWATRLAADRRFDAAANEFVVISEVMDRIYQRNTAEDHGSG